jgi:hypothetical protein
LERELNYTEANLNKIHDDVASRCGFGQARWHSRVLKSSLVIDGVEPEADPLVFWCHVIQLKNESYMTGGLSVKKRYQDKRAVELSFREGLVDFKYPPNSDERTLFKDIESEKKDGIIVSVSLGFPAASRDLSNIEIEEITSYLVRLCDLAQKLGY